MSDMNRRAFAKSASMIAAGAALAGVGAVPIAAAQSGPAAAPDPKLSMRPVEPKGTPFRIGMLIFDDMTHLDVVGPHHLLVRPPNAKVHLIGKTLDPITTDAGSRVLADTLLRDAPPLDMIFVPGGGVGQVMRDPEVLDFLRERAPKAKFVTAVCTGTLVLGAAGLMRGKRAATHWTTMDILPLLDIIPVHERVVIDGNRITGGGVTAGIDFGLVVLDHIWGRQLAEGVQLASEYDPAPPFNAGSPRTAPKETVEMVLAMTKAIRADMAVAARDAAKRFT